MKTLIFSIIFSSLGVAANAGELPQINVEKTFFDMQDTIPKSDSTRTIKVGKVKVVINPNTDDVEVEIDEEVDANGEGNSTVVVNTDKKLDNVKTRWLLLDLGVSTYLDNDFNYNVPENLEQNIGKSTNVNLHLFRQRLNLINHNLNLMYGLTFEFNNYKFENNVTLLPKKDYLTFEEIEEPIKKTKLANTYLNLPVMLNFETNPYNLKRSFRINAGGFAGYLLEAHTKIKYSTDKKVKDRDDFNLSKFKYGVTSQIGYGWFNIYANYALSEMFADGEGPVLHPFNFGIVLIGF